jgi:hypothetical protein
MFIVHDPFFQKEDIFEKSLVYFLPLIMVGWPEKN